MRPVNQKSLLAVLYKNIDDVDSCDAVYLEEEIQKLDALVRATGMTVQMMGQELQRAKLEKELNEYNGTKNEIHIRELETKGFDDTTKG